MCVKGTDKIDINSRMSAEIHSRPWEHKYCTLGLLSCFIQSFRLLLFTFVRLKLQLVLILNFSFQNVPL